MQTDFWDIRIMITGGVLKKWSSLLCIRSCRIARNKAGLPDQLLLQEPWRQHNKSEISSHQSFSEVPKIDFHLLAQHMECGVSTQ
jgi:hypothetical protein